MLFPYAVVGAGAGRKGNNAVVGVNIYAEVVDRALFKVCQQFAVVFLGGVGGVVGEISGDFYIFNGEYSPNAL